MNEMLWVHPLHASRAYLEVTWRRERGCAEIMSSLLSNRNPSFLATHSGQTGLGSTHDIFDKGQNQAFGTKINVASPVQSRLSLETVSKQWHAHIQ